MISSPPIDVSCRSHFITLDKEARRDISAWFIFVEECNGPSLLLDSRYLSSNYLDFYTDVVGSFGFAAIFQSHWFYGSWPALYADFDITFKELLPIVLALEIWGPSLANKCISLHSDNMAVVCILNKQTSKDKNLMFLVRQFVLCCMLYNILTRAVHITGKLLKMSYLIYFFQVDAFHHQSVDMDLLPSLIPCTLWRFFVGPYLPMCMLLILFI